MPLARTDKHLSVYFDQTVIVMTTWVVLSHMTAEKTRPLSLISENSLSLSQSVGLLQWNLGSGCFESLFSYQCRSFTRHAFVCPTL